MMKKLIFLWLLSLSTAFGQVVTTFDISEFRPNPITRSVPLNAVDTTQAIAVILKSSAEGRLLDLVDQPAVQRVGLSLRFGWMSTANLPASSWLEITIGTRVRYAGTVSINKNTSNPITPTPGTSSLVGFKPSFEVANYEAAKALAIGLTRKEIYVLADETNGGFPTYYDYAPTSTALDHLDRRITN